MNFIKLIKFVSVCSLFTTTVYSMDSEQTKKVNEIYQLLFNAGVGIIASSAEVGIDQPLVYFKNAIQQKQKIDWSNPKKWWRGGSLNLLALAPTTAIQVALNEYLAKFFKKNKKSEVSQFGKIFSALTAGFFSGFVSTPTELGIIHQQNTGMSILNTFKFLKQNYGPGIFARGILPTALRDAGFSAGYLVLPQIIKQYCSKFTTNDAILKVGPGILAGLICTGFTHPFDVIKTKMQSNPDNKRYRSTFRTLLDVIKKEGISELGKGIVPRGTRVVSAIFIMSNVVETLNNLFKTK